jgi:hypothetical protein
LHTILVAVLVFRTHDGGNLVGLYVLEDKGKVVEWVTEANLQGTDTIAGCREMS